MRRCLKISSPKKATKERQQPAQSRTNALLKFCKVSRAFSGFRRRVSRHWLGLGTYQDFHKFSSPVSHNVIILLKRMTYSYKVQLFVNLRTSPFVDQWREWASFRQSVGCLREQEFIVCQREGAFPAFLQILVDVHH